MEQLTKSYIEINESCMMLVDDKGVSISQYPRDHQGSSYRLLSKQVDALIRLPRWGAGVIEVTR